MERFAAFYPIAFILAILVALVLSGKVVLPAAVSAMVMPVFLLAGIMLVVIVMAVRSR